jgi:hypothetical protein
LADSLQIAIMYLTVFAGAGVVFMFCSFWVYHYVELDFDLKLDEAKQEEDSPALEDLLHPFAETNPSTGAQGS